MSNEERATEIANGYGTYSDSHATGASGTAYHAALAMAEWKDEQFADYLQQSWQRYKAAPTPTASAKRHLIEQMANDLGVRLKFNNPYID